MTTYTAITDTETGHQKPLTISLVRRLRDNALAMQQGDATAPSILVGIAAKSNTGGVGTYAFLSSTTLLSFTASANYAGSSLKYSGLNSASASTPFAADINTSGVVPSGTWKAMGTSSGTAATGTLFLRIS